MNLATRADAGTVGGGRTPRAAVHRASAFFDRAEALAEQVATALGGGSTEGLAPEGTEPPYPGTAPGAEHGLELGMTLAFLACLRAWARESLGAGHASTPQVHRYAPGACGKWRAETAPADWRYFYLPALGPPATLRFAGRDGSGAGGGRPRLFRLRLSAVREVAMEPNGLLVCSQDLSYSVLSGGSAGIILLCGWLW